MNTLPELHIAAVQAPLTWENAVANRAYFEAQIRSRHASMQLDATLSPIDVWVLPEMFTTGFSMAPEQHAEPHMGDSVRWMQQLADEYRVAIVGSIITKGTPLHSSSTKEGYFNRLYWVTPFAMPACYDKRHLFSMAGEHKHYTAGMHPLQVQFRDWRINLAICYDLRFPVWLRNRKENPYDLLIVVANWPERRVAHWRSLLVARAIENQTYVVGVNRIGPDGNGIAHSGSSMIIDPIGNIRQESVNEAKVLHATLKQDDLALHRRHMPFLSDQDSFMIEV